MKNSKADNARGRYHFEGKTVDGHAPHQCKKWVGGGKATGATAGYP